MLRRSISFPKTASVRFTVASETNCVEWIPSVANRYYAESYAYGDYGCWVYSPLLGKSFTEIAGEGRSMHKVKVWVLGRTAASL